MTMGSYQNCLIEVLQILVELIEMAQRFKEASGRGEALRLNEDELAFHDALMMNEYSARESSDTPSWRAFSLK